MPSIVVLPMVDQGTKYLRGPYPLVMLALYTRNRGATAPIPVGRTTRTPATTATTLAVIHIIADGERSCLR
jgi:hypothetical protein